MATAKLSQIASSPANLVAADTLIGVHSGTTDYQFSGTQVLALVTGTANTWASGQTFVAPVLGTPASGTLTNATGLPIASGVSGMGTGVATALAANVGTAGAPVVNGGALGTPSSGVATNLTGTAASLTAGNVTAGWHTIKKATTDQTTANTAAKVTSWSVTIPANTLNANGAVRFSAVFKFVNTNGTKQVGVDFGGTTLWSSNAAAASTLGIVITPQTIYNRNSASSQIGALTGSNAATASTIPATSSIDMTQDQTLTFWITLGSASDTGVLQSGQVEYNNDNP